MRLGEYFGNLVFPSMVFFSCEYATETMKRHCLILPLVLPRCRNWDARRSTTSSLDAVAKLVKERPESFEEKTAKRASVAAAPLAAWVLANLQYGQILQQVAPLEREQRLLAEYVASAP